MQNNHLNKLLQRSKTSSFLTTAMQKQSKLLIVPFLSEKPISIQPFFLKHKTFLPANLSTEPEAYLVACNLITLKP